ncbi:TPA: NAD-dependent epimerase/dehydratase family protein [Campylobacter jejuni]
MLKEKLILQDRLKKIKKTFYEVFKQIQNQNILISGANGFIGSILCLSLLNHCKVFCLVRNKSSMLSQFQRIYGNSDEINIVEHLDDITDEIDIVIHCASPTQSNFFVEYPIGTIDSIYNYTKTLLDFSLKYKIKKFIFLSTMEVYGEVAGENVSEKEIGTFDISNLRNSYPLAKQLCEFMVYAYTSKTNLNASILRLTQTIGPGAKLDDNRVYMEFIRSGLNKSNITLMTQGATRRNYIDVFDAVTAILFSIFDNKNIEIYNIANSKIYISIYELAKLIALQLKVKVDFSLNKDISQYLKSFERNLNTEKIQKLGWYPLFDLKQSIKDMIYFVREENKI